MQGCKGKEWEGGKKGGAMRKGGESHAFGFCRLESSADTCGG